LIIHKIFSSIIQVLFFFSPVVDSKLAVLSVNLKKVKYLAAQGEETKGTKRYYYNNNSNKNNNNNNYNYNNNNKKQRRN
jgi:hypothetical protein